jgi:hypothetical protein
MVLPVPNVLNNPVPNKQEANGLLNSVFGNQYLPQGSLNGGLGNINANVFSGNRNVINGNSIQIPRNEKKVD